MEQCVNIVFTVINVPGAWLFSKREGGVYWGQIFNKEIESLKIKQIQHNMTMRSMTYRFTMSTLVIILLYFGFAKSISGIFWSLVSLLTHNNARQQWKFCLVVFFFFHTFWLKNCTGHLFRKRAFITSNKLYRISVENASK